MTTIKTLLTKYRTSGGAAVLAELDQLAKAGDKVARATEQVTRATAAEARQFERLRRELDPFYAAQQRAEANTRLLARALDRGSIDAQQHARLMDTLTQKHAEAAAAVLS